MTCSNSQGVHLTRRGSESLWQFAAHSRRSPQERASTGGPTDTALGSVFCATVYNDSIVATDTSNRLRFAIADDKVLATKVASPSAGRR